MNRRTAIFLCLCACLLLISTVASAKSKQPVAKIVVTFANNATEAGSGVRDILRAAFLFARPC